jgi:hypothetical protein
MKIPIGSNVFVVDGSGLDSGRRGIVVNSRQYSQEQIRKLDYGRYNSFDHNNESLVQDERGIFAMFNNRLRIIS